MTYIRIRWMKLGRHYHCRMFTSQHFDGMYTKNGDLVFDEQEWPDIRDKLVRCQFLSEESQ